jgi:soluble lytic murein transglycosylase-like protein
MWILLLAMVAQSSVDLQRASIARQEQAAVGRMRVSLGLQAASVRKQAGRAVEVAALVSPEAEDVGCEVLPPMRASKLVQDASQRHGISAQLLQAVIQQESSFRPCAVSNKGARGLMQLMPATMVDFGVTDAFDPEQNVSAGAALLKKLTTRYGGDLNRVLGAYNAGPGRVDAADGVPAIPETLQYVDKILGSLAEGENP